MSLYAIADLHLPLSTGKEKTMEIFPGWRDYVQRLKYNWEKLVNVKDTVVIGGDLSWAMKLEDAFEDFNFLNSLPGRKILIKGNHDYWWSSKSKMERYLALNNFNTIFVLHNSAEMAENFSICGTRGWFLDLKEENDAKILKREVGRLETSINFGIKMGLEPVVFMHYPPVYDTFECKEIMDVLVASKIKKCYYGHLHGRYSAKKARIGEYKGIHFSLISCDYLNFTPLLVE